MVCLIEQKHDGVLLRTYLQHVLFLSRSLVSRLKRIQGIKVNGENVTVRYVLKSGDVLEVFIEDDEKNENIMPVDIPLEIVYEDEEIVVIDKPPFMPVHPSHGHHMDTLANALYYRYKDGNFVMRAVNRLDRNTSGLVLVAKNRRSAFILSNQMKNREIGKKYLALVLGTPSSEFEIKAYMRRKEQSVIERVICNSFEDGAEFSHTTGKTLQVFDVPQDKKEYFGEFEKFSLVELTPHTGRTHQLRVHMAFLGFPILGDDVYGIGGDRQMLHCGFLEIRHPNTMEKMSFTSKFRWTDEEFLRIQY